jgi:microcompartment protein CcmL/EutN
MVKNALGLIEIVGLAAAIEAADAAIKAANVELIGYELTKGGGLVVVKLTGDVGAVMAGVEAGKIAGGKVNKVWATHVIPRPHQQLSGILTTPETVGITTKKDSEPVIPRQTQGISLVKHSTAIGQGQEQAEAVKPQTTSPAERNNQAVKPAENIPGSQQQSKQPTDICNLCGDPACSRIKGDPKVTCIHYDPNNKEAE